MIIDGTVSLPMVVNAISLKESTFTWKDEADEEPTLQDITVDVRHGELFAVVGVVGSGKSSLISALLGDMLKLKGSVAVSVSISLHLLISMHNINTNNHRCPNKALVASSLLKLTYHTTKYEMVITYHLHTHLMKHQFDKYLPSEKLANMKHN